MSKIDEILDTAIIDGQDPENHATAVMKAKAQLLQLVIDEVIGEPERTWTPLVTKKKTVTDIRNDLRKEQRQKAYELFGKEQEKCF